MRPPNSLYLPTEAILNADGYYDLHVAGGIAYWVDNGNGPSDFTAGGDLSGTSTNQTVIGIDGIPLSITTLTNGNTLVYNGTDWVNALITNSNVDPAAAIQYSKLNLLGNIVNSDIAGGAAISVSKLAAGTSAQVLLNSSAPAATWTSITGDVFLTYTGATTLSKIQTVPLMINSLTTGNSLSYNGSDWVNAPISLGGGSGYVSGTLPAGNQAAQSLTLTGDAVSSGGTTSSASTTVSGLLTHALPSLADGYLNWTGSAWALNTISVPSGFTAGGDLSGSSTSQTVVGLDTTPIVITTLTSGNALTYNGTDWVNALLSNSNISASAAVAVGKLAAGTSGQVLLNSTTPTPTWATVSGDMTISATGVVANTALTGSAGIVSIPHGTTNISGATAASDIAPGTITITGQLPFASAATNKTPGGLVLATGAPVAGGSVGTVSVVNDGYTQLQLGYASTDFIALGASPASAGLIRLPAIGSITTAMQLGTIPVIWNNGGFLAIGNTSTVQLQMLSSGTIALEPSGAATNWSFSSSGLAISGSSSVQTIAPGTRATATPIVLAAGAGLGAASTSSAGGLLTLAGGAAAVATSGTAAGAVGGAVSAVGGVGAAGLGTSQNGGAGGNITIGSGAGGLATSGGTNGAAGSVITQIGGTTVMSHGVSGVGMTPAAASVSGVTGGTTILSAAQYLLPIIRLSGTLVSASTVVFPNAAGVWAVDVSGLSGLSGTNTLTFQSGSATTTAITSLTSLSSVYSIYTYGGNTISINV